MVEIGFMSFAKYALTMMGDSFVLLEQGGLYALIVLIPLTALVSIKLSGRTQK